jgi:hypothetical protein
MGLENYFNVKSIAKEQNEFVKDLPSMKSFACTLNEEQNKEIEKQMKSKWQLEKAINQDRIMMPQDTRGLVMLYGVNKEDEKKRTRQNSRDSTEGSFADEELQCVLDSKNSFDSSNNIRGRSNSFNQKRGAVSREPSCRQKGLELNQRKMLSTSIFGQERQKVYEISSYKKDAANLIANRIIKKFRGYFAVLYDFAAF